MTVMRRGPDTDIDRIAQNARTAASRPVRIPLLAIHGGSDDVVAPLNAIALVRQYLDRIAAYDKTGPAINAP